jgi:hypothetical protein
MRCKGWFGPKLIGYGIAPRSWQGWAATGFLVIVLVGSRFIRPEDYGWPHWVRPVVAGCILLAYLALVGATYDRDI